jgi:predicted transcriptional regulator
MCPQEYSQRDILKVISLDQLYKPTSAHDISLLDMTVQSFMSKPVISISANITLWEAIQVMQEKRIRRLPVTERKTGKLVGIITEKDVMKIIAQNRTIFCDLTEKLPENSLMIERFREYGLSESLFPLNDNRQIGPQ